MKRLVLLALLSVLSATAADAQIIRPVERSRPIAFTSLSVGWFQQSGFCNAETSACYSFGGAPQFRATLEKPIGSGGASIGIAGTTARTPLTYSGSGLLPSSCSRCDADANVSQLLANGRLGGGVGFHQVIDFQAGATMYSNFRATDGTRLGSGGSTYDMTFGIGYGFGYSTTNRMEFVLVQEWAMAIHKRLPGSAENTSQQQNIRIGVRLALGDR